MAPKATEQVKKAAQQPQHAAQLLPLPELSLGPIDLQTNDTSVRKPSTFEHGADQLEAADPLQAALGLFATDADGDVDDQQEYVQLMSVLQTVMKSKQEKKEKKRQALVQELQETVIREVDMHKAAAAKEHKAMLTMLQSGLNGARQQLNKKFKALEDIHARYNQDMSAAWAEYQAAFKKLQASQATATSKLDATRDVHKRKLGQLQTSLTQKMADTEQRLAKISKSGNSKTVEGMLKQFMSIDT